MKGQFMVLSAVLIALILISLGSVISSIQTEEFEPSETEHQLNYIERQADYIYEDGNSNRVERNNFQSIVNEMDYTNEVQHGSGYVNVTLERPGELYRLQFLGQ